MKHKLRMLLAAMLAVVSLLVVAGASNYEHYADQLNSLGLFQGTDAGYELDRAPTRSEAATMLVRLLGKEQQALQLEYTAPFTDLEGWEKPYVQYLYDNGLTTGASETTFEPLEACSAQMYTTFLLRALGYSDAEGQDFSYAQAVSFGESIGLVDDANCDQSNFLRDHVVAMSMSALGTAVQSDDDTVLLEQLVDEGAVDASAAEALLNELEAGTQPEEEQPVDEQPEEEQPVDEQPEEEQPAEQPEEEQPVEEQPAEEPEQPVETPVSEADYAAQVVELVNVERAKMGLPALAMNSGAQQAAQLRAAEIVEVFSHDRPDGSACYTALTEIGVSYRAAGENIAMGYPTPEAVVDGWMNSEGHRANILRDTFSEIGVGYVVEDGTAYWVQMFLG